MVSSEIWVVAGTRPEVIKQIPVFRALKNNVQDKTIRLVLVTQHRDLLDQAVKVFGESADLVIDLERSQPSLAFLGSQILSRMGEELQTRKPCGILVQGDTATGAMTAIAAFYNQIPVWHNEAGLRSYDLSQPYPEEANRKWITSVASLHFAPTKLAAQALEKEGVPEKQIHIVGNSGIDSLFWALNQPVQNHYLTWVHELQKKNRKLCLMTSHRRENSGAVVEAWYEAIQNFSQLHPEVSMLIPVHPNQMAVRAIENSLSQVKNQIQICEPLDYVTTAHILQSSDFVVTDSGGIQEEAATLGVPVVVCRKKSERMEAIHAGVSRLVDPENPTQLLASLNWALQKTKGPRTDLYGDGQASLKIAEILKDSI